MTAIGSLATSWDDENLAAATVGFAYFSVISPAFASRCLLTRYSLLAFGNH